MSLLNSKNPYFIYALSNHKYNYDSIMVVGTIGHIITFPMYMYVNVYMFCPIHNSCTRIDNLVNSFWVALFVASAIHAVYACCYLLYCCGFIVEAYCIHICNKVIILVIICCCVFKF